MHILGMQTQRHRNVVGILLMHRGKARHALQILVGQDDVTHTCFTSPLNDLYPILVKCIAINM